MPATATKNAFIRARINDQLRDDASSVLENLGLTISDVMRMTLTRIAREKAVPFELFTPNPATRTAMHEAQEIMTARRHRFATGKDLMNGLEENDENASI
jgi:DNA-damage-inducible protein J|tara:strand:- start:268 stop:567 length:300 start_codon:yes stop_codon:yes gene_type:complete